MEQENIDNNETSNEESGENNDPIKNIKSEMSRKFSNFEEKNEKISNQLDQLERVLSTLATNTAPKTPDSSSEDYEDLILTDPKKAVNKIKKETLDELTSIQERQNQEQHKINTTWAKVASEFPEFNDTTSEVHKRGTQILADMVKSSVTGTATSYDYEIAMRRAAAEKGLIPVGSRMDEEQEYTGPGSSRGSGGIRDRKNIKKDENLDEKTLQFAQLLGRNINDPKYLAKLKDIQSKRKNNWKQYK